MKLKPPERSLQESQLQWLPELERAIRDNNQSLVRLAANAILGLAEKADPGGKPRNG